MAIPKNTSIFSISLILLISFPLRVFSIQPRFYLSQSIDQAGDYGLSCSSVTGYFDSRLSVKDGELYSWSLASEPVRGVRLLAGSLAFSGIPARARNPVFSVSSAFYAPVGVMTGKVVNYGTTKDTGRIGLDCSLGLWRVAGFASPAGLSDGPAWLQVSRVLVFPGKPATLARFSIFGGLRRQEPSADPDWFRRNEYVPATDVASPGFEIVASKGGLSASFIGFSSLSRLRKPAGAFAADASFSSKFFSCAGGIYGADYAFTDLDGDGNEVLRRIFLAPTLRIPLGAGKGTEFTLGAILYADTMRNASIKESVPMIVSGETEARLQWRAFYGYIQAKRTNEGADFSCSAIFRRFIADWLQWQLKGQTSALLDDRITPNLADSKVASKITARVGQLFSIGLGMSASFPDIGDEAVFSGDVAATLSLKRPNSLWKISFAASKANRETPATMKLSFAITVK